MTAEPLRQRDLAFVADRADDRRAQKARPLNRDHPDPAGRRVEQDRLARLHPVRPPEQVVRGQALEQDRRRDVVADAVGNFHRPVRDDIVRLAISPDRSRRISDAVAFAKPRDARADAFDHAGRFESEARGQGNFVEPGPVIDIDEVDADRGMAHAHFALARRPERDVLKRQNLRPAGRLDPDRARHGVALKSNYGTKRPEMPQPHYARAVATVPGGMTFVFSWISSWFGSVTGGEQVCPAHR